MLGLSEALRAWGTPEFETILKRELAQQAEQLPLQQGLSQSSSVVDAPVTVIVHSVTAEDDVIRVRAGISYQGIISGCSCADDPTPMDVIEEYCEVQLEVDRGNGNATVILAENGGSDEL